MCSAGSAVSLVFAMMRMKLDRRLIALIALIDRVAYRRNRHAVKVVVEMELVGEENDLNSLDAKNKPSLTSQQLSAPSS